MELSIDQSWENLESCVRRHAIEKQSYDLNNPYGAKLREYNYDFTAIAEGARMTGTYKDVLDDDDLDDLD